MRSCWKEILPLLFVLLVSCSTTKYVPEDKLLLNKAKITVDAKELANTDLKGYLRQTQNAEIFGFWKLQLDLYNLSGKDSTRKINPLLRRMGEAPVVFDPQLADVSRIQLQRFMVNKGFFNAVVDTTMRIKNRKLWLAYNIVANSPYYLNNYDVVIANQELRGYATEEKHTLLHRGMLFDVDIMDAERARIAYQMRRHGYYYFEKDFLSYEADSVGYDHKIDLEMHLREDIQDASKDVYDILFARYTVTRVNFYTDFDPTHVPEGLVLDTVSNGNYYFYTTKHKLLRSNTLMRYCKIRPGDMYDVANEEDSYAALNSLGPIKYVNISYRQVGEQQLECNVVLTRAKTNTVSADVEGTYTAGDWGVAAEVGYSNRNVFRGAEELTVKGRGAYEWRQNGGRAIEGKGEVGLTFPSKVKINVAYNYQNRPNEYTRTIANGALQYTYQKPYSPWRHTFNLLEVNYVYLPWIDEDFKRLFENTAVYKYSYEDHFIFDWSYIGSYSSKRANQPMRSYVNLQYSVETAGNLLYGICNWAKLPKNDKGLYEVFKIPFSQYAKADVNFSGYHIMSKHSTMVYHAFVGVAVPFGNASSIPFEKRYFGGGANSVRGWTLRSLGPGQFKSGNTGGRVDYNTQSGDIKLDVNIEYRLKCVKMLELAAFVDAGNIWTIREYENQPGGCFHFNTFYRQIALSYGVGIRLDFSFFIFRVDFGVKLHDPSRIDEGKQWRTVHSGLCWADDMALHFAIGHPF